MRKVWLTLLVAALALAPAPALRASYPGNVQWTSNAAKVVPTAAAGVSVTPSGSSWGNSAWVEVTPATSSAWVVTAVSVTKIGANVEFEVELGVGAAGAEAPIGTVSGAATANSNMFGRGQIVFPVPLDSVPNGSRVAIRLRKSGTSTTTWEFKVQYLEKPIVGNVTATTVAPTTLPNATDGTAVSGTTGFANSSWAALTTSAPSDLTVGALELDPTSVGGTVSPSVEIDLGIGAIGAESVVYTVRTQATRLGAGQRHGLGVIVIKPLARIIASGERVSWRIRNDASVATTWRLKLLVYPNYSVAATTSAAAALSFPAGSASLSVAGTTNYSRGSWAEAIATTASDYALVGWSWHGNANGHIEFDFGLGGSGSESVIATVHTYQQVSAQPVAESTDYFAIPYFIPAGSRVAFRQARQTTAQGIGLIMLPAADVPVTTTYVQGVWPINADPNTVAGSGSAYGDSAYALLIADSGNADVVITDLVAAIATTVTGIDWEWVLAFGGAGAETDVCTIAQGINNNTSGYGRSVLPLAVPLKVPAHTRVSFKYRKGGTSTTANGASVMYVRPPDLTAGFPHPIIGDPRDWFARRTVTMH